MPVGHGERCGSQTRCVFHGLCEVAMASSGTQPQQVIRQARLLRQAVLSSCSDRPLCELIAELRAIDGVDLFDLLLLREIDIWEIERSKDAQGRERKLLPLLPADGMDTRTSTQILAIEDNLTPISEWIREQFRKSAPTGSSSGLAANRISAFATFFPDITSRSQEKVALPGTRLDGMHTPRELAILALVNTVKLALGLKDLIADSCSPRKPVAIVEIVCGTILDRCQCPECEGDRRNRGFDRAVIAKREYKYDLLCGALEQVCSRLEGEDSDWALAMELEPGPTYVLQDLDAIGQVFARLDALDTRVAAHVGLNLDIGHMKIAEVYVTSPQQLGQGHLPGLEQFADRIVHTHISDHPGMHTRDQVVGVWNPVERLDSVDYSYLTLLAEVADGTRGRNNGLPFSGTVALELEGCSRIGWVHRSVTAMKHMAQIVARQIAPPKTPPKAFGRA